MAEFAVKLPLLSTQASDIDGYSREMRNLCSEINRVSRDFYAKSRATAEIMSKVRRYSAAASKQADMLDAMSAVLKQTRENYRKTEELLLGINSSDGKDNPNDKKNWFLNYDWGKFLNKLIGKAGILGGLIKEINEAIASGDIVKALLHLGKGITSKLPDLVSAVSENGTVAEWAEDLLGLTKPIKTLMEKTKGNKFSDYFSQSWGDEWGKFVGKDGTLKAVCKWAGVALTGALTGYEKYNKYGGMTSDAIVETISETAVDTVKNVLITAGVTAGLAAIGAAGAPAIVVGGITVVVAEGLDHVCEQLYKKDFNETVSDLAIKAGTAIADNVSSWWDNLFSG